MEQTQWTSILILGGPPGVSKNAENLQTEIPRRLLSAVIKGNLAGEANNHYKQNVQQKCRGERGQPKVASSKCENHYGIRYSQLIRLLTFHQFRCGGAKTGGSWESCWNCGTLLARLQ